MFRFVAVVSLLIGGLACSGSTPSTTPVSELAAPASDSSTTTPPPAPTVATSSAAESATTTAASVPATLLGTTTTAPADPSDDATAIHPTIAFDSFTFNSRIVLGDGEDELSVATNGTYFAPNYRCEISLELGGLAVVQTVAVIDGVAYFDDGFSDIRETTIDDPDILQSNPLCPGTSEYWRDLSPFGSTDDLTAFVGEPSTVGGRAATEYDLSSVGAFGSILEGFPFEAIESFRIVVDEASSAVVLLELIGTATDQSTAQGLPAGDGGTFAVILSLDDINTAEPVQLP